MKALSYTAILLATLVSMAAPAGAETRIDIVKPTNVSTAAPAYTVTTSRGLFGETLQQAISPSGVVYMVPGSSLEESTDSFMRSGIFGAKTSRKTCGDGKPAAYLYHFPGGPDCAADRPQ